MTIHITNLENFFIWIGKSPGKEKITIGGTEPGVHYTIIFKKDRKVIDIHKTNELAEGQIKYEQFLEMSFFTFLRFISSFNNKSVYLIRKLFFSRQINLGKLRHYNFILLPITTDISKANLFFDTKRKSKIKLRKEFSVEPILQMILYPEQILKSNENAFWVYSTKKSHLSRQGIVFKHDSTKMGRSFYFVTDKDFRKYILAMENELVKCLSQLDFVNKQSIINYLSPEFTLKQHPQKV